MTTEEKIQMVKVLVGDDSQATDAVVCTYLKLASNAMLNRLYPFGNAPSNDIPEAYAVMLCELAGRMFLKRGAEGEIAHNENGINRTFKGAEYDEILNKIHPFVKFGGA